MNAITLTRDWSVVRPRAWWRTRGFVALALVCSIVPLLWPATPPLVDLPGHIGRYRILAEAGQLPLARHWAVHWSLLGNLGVDLIVLALHPLLDVEAAARLVVTAIPLLTAASMLWLAREAHGRLPAGAALALPLAYAWPFQLGFVNFCLAQALAFAGVALWLRLRGRWTLPVRAALFAPVACVVWLAHSFGWAMLGLWIGGAEWALQRREGRSIVTAALGAGLACVSMALPLLAPLAGAVSPRGDTGLWFDWAAKTLWLASVLRERWVWWDLGGVALLAGVLVAACRSQRLSFAPVLGVPALLSFAVFVALPICAGGGTYVDMRIAPAAVALALLAIRVAPDEPATERRVARLATAFLLARTVGTTVAFVFFAREQATALRAVPALPAGGAVLVLVAEPAEMAWSGPRLAHIAGLAVARARVFDNEQWALPGQQPIRPLHPRAAPFSRDPSQMIRPRDLDAAVRRFDRCTFDAVWTMNLPAVHARDLRPVWADDASAVYRVRRPDACPPPR